MGRGTKTPVAKEILTFTFANSFKYYTDLFADPM